MLDEIVRRTNRISEAWKSCHCMTGRVAVNEAVGDLLEILLEADLPEPSPAEVEALFEATLPQISFDFPDGLQSLAPHLMPIAVMREIMRRRGIDFDPEQVPNWGRFMAKYGAVIIAFLRERAPPLTNSGLPQTSHWAHLRIPH